MKVTKLGERLKKKRSKKSHIGHEWVYEKDRNDPVLKKKSRKHFGKFSGKKWYPE